MILMLALYLYAGRGRDRSGDFQAHFSTQLTDDLTSLGESDRAGDPFTTVKTDEPPSLSADPGGPDEAKTSQPEIPNLARFGPQLSGPEPAPLASTLGSGPPSRLTPGSARDLGAIVSGLHSEDMTAPFSGRDEMTRARLVRREGGTVHSEKAVEDGLSWITRHQRGDGGWSLDYHPQCQGQGCPSHTSGRLIDSDTGATGLALLPLLGAGHSHLKKTRYQTQVRQGLAWLVDHQQPSGELFVGGSPLSRMYSHAIAAMAVCEAYGLTHDPGLRRPAQRAVDFIAAAQEGENGGWRYQPGQPGDTSVFGWQMFALRSARLSGLRVSKNVARGCKTYLDSASTDAKRQVTGEGCDRGSWDPASPQPDRWASSGGRLFLTSLSTLTLEVYYRYLPLYQPSDRDPVKLEEPEKAVAVP
ncbi:MAG: hypothetical protein LC745_11085 [Planctomycetia bacterium]|nr:hypothetical protein [Planctomycetia bacterium]